jgi:nucleoside-diphosphate-sugar epimerase
MLLCFIELELADFRAYDPAGVFLQAQVTDLALAMDNPRILAAFVDAVRRLSGGAPGFMTHNFGTLAAKCGEWGIPLGAAIAPWGESGAGMRPDNDGCEKATRGLGRRRLGRPRGPHAGPRRSRTEIPATHGRHGLPPRRRCGARTRREPSASAWRVEAILEGSRDHRMNILITGAAGFLGSHVARLAARRNHQIRCFVRPTSNLEGLGVSREHLCLGDMTDAASVHEAVKGMYAVIHCAATTSEGAPDLELSRRVNVEGTRRLLEAALAAGAKRWIQISSMSAHPDSTSVYGRTKLEADEVVRQSDADWTILRPSLIFGPGGKGLVAKTQQLMKKLPVMPVVGPGRELIRPVFVTDVAHAALNCLESPITIHKTYMIGGADEIELNEFFRRLGARIGAKRPLIHIPIPVAMLMARAFGLVTKTRPSRSTMCSASSRPSASTSRPRDHDFQFAPMGFDEALEKTLEG